MSESEWVGEWVTEFGVRFFVYLKPFENFGFYYMPRIFFWRGLVSQVLQMLWSWNLHQGWPLINEFDWLRDQSSHVVSVYFTDQKPFLLISSKMTDGVINQLLWSRRLPRVIFILTACLEPVKQDDHYFRAEILVCKFRLGLRKACLRMCKRFCNQIFLCQNVSKEILFSGTKFHAKPSRGSGVI